MNKKSKVTNVQANGTWKGRHGLMYKFEVSFENGDAGEYSSKSKDQNKFIEGQETDYEFIDGKYPKVKPVWLQEQTQSTPPTQSTSKRTDDVQDLIVRQSSLKAAVDFCDSDCTVDHIIANAEIFYDWVMRNEKTNNNNNNNNDLPF